MATLTNNDRIKEALDILKSSLGVYVLHEFSQAFGERWFDEICQGVRVEFRPSLGTKEAPHLDVATLLGVLRTHAHFKRKFDIKTANYAHELGQVRNDWAHQKTFSTDDTERALDTARRLLEAINEAKAAAALANMREELRRASDAQKVRNAKKTASYQVVNGQIVGGIKPWRTAVTPHRDVLSERFNEAEFAADLWQVAFGEQKEVAAEYKDPQEFFRRTYLTASLKTLLSGALRRLSGQGGDPVVQLQTNFGGGKTHSMLALWHLFSGVALKDLPGLEVLASADLPQGVRRVALVGTKISASGLEAKPDGTRIKTLWGELAWQLGGRAAYERVREDDENATNPGSRLDALLRQYGPALILIDEWVAYARELPDDKDLPGGDFETQFTFAQALTEAVSATGNALLVVSLPASDAAGQGDAIEVGGVRGREALKRLDNVVRRKATAWTPASEDESFLIVRRRLFEDLNAEAYKACDMTARAFAELYRAERSEFPDECAEADYERRIKESYPVHPEVFKRLYADWGALPQFQRTRGVLRLMAGIIRLLWKHEDQNPLILPAHLPIALLQSEFLRYLGHEWAAIVASDVDGADALPLRMDEGNPNLGRFSACRRVARTVFLGSAATLGTRHQGLENKRIKLGSVQPGEKPNLVDSALGRLAEQATYLHQDGGRAWFDTAPTLNKLARNRAEQLERDEHRVEEEICARVRQMLHTERGQEAFARVHPFPNAPGDVADDMAVRLVILAQKETHTRGRTGGDREASPACRAAQILLEQRGNAPRHYRNTLVFLAADHERIVDAQAAARSFLAWQSIVADAVSPLNLTPTQKAEAERQRLQCEREFAAKLEDGFCWLLLPAQDDPTAPVVWHEYRLSGNEGLVARLWKKLQARDVDAVCVKLAASALKRLLDKIPLWRAGDDGAGGKAHVEVRQLAEDFASYLYLPRLKNSAVLIDAVQTGVAQLSILWADETFAWAESYDEAQKRYLGLMQGKPLSLPDTGNGLLVEGHVAKEQIDGERPTPVPPVPPQPPGTGCGDDPQPPKPPEPLPPVRQTHFYGTTEIDPLAAKTKLREIAEEVVALLTAAPGVRVTLKLDIEAEAEQGFDKALVRSVSENCTTLGFARKEFE